LSFATRRVHLLYEIEVLRQTSTDYIRAKTEFACLTQVH
jgi:hypothetical protein